MSQFFSGIIWQVAKSKVAQTTKDRAPSKERERERARKERDTQEIRERVPSCYPVHHTMRLAVVFALVVCVATCQAMSVAHVRNSVFCAAPRGGGFGGLCESLC